jgi:hypothetical protein
MLFFLVLFFLPGSLFCTLSFMDQGQPFTARAETP